MTLDQLVTGVRPGDFAVFDADGTLWTGDVTESLFASLVQRDLRFDRLPDSLQPYPAHPGEDPFSYYLRITKADISLGYAWIASAFAGYRLGDLVERLEALQEEARPPSGPHGPIAAPHVRPEMVALRAALEERGCACWIVSASPEPLVRWLATHPRFGAGFNPARIIGVDVLLHKSDATLSWGSCREHGTVPDLAALHSYKMGTLLRSPNPWFEGKVAAIRRWIAQTANPWLVAGDSLNDVPMLSIAHHRVWWGSGAPPAELGPVSVGLVQTK